MKIGIVANTSFNIYNFRLSLIHFLVSKGFRVVAIAPRDNFTEKIIKEGIEFVEIKKLSRKGTNPWQDFLLMFELKKIYKSNQLDIVLQYTIKPNIYGSFAAKLVGIKSICTVTGLGYTFLNNSFASKVSKWLYRTAFHFSDIILFQNNDDKMTFLELNLAKESKMQIVLGSGIDTQRFNPDYCENEPIKDNDVFLFIGRLLKDKGIFEFIDAAKKIIHQYPQTKFLIVGEMDKDNPSSISQKELDAITLIPNIKYLGFLSDTRVALCQATCVVLPSYREGLPRVILEAMAMGKPSITTDVPGCRDAVDDKCALLAEVENANDLALKIDEFIHLTFSAKAEMGFSARKRAETIFSLEIIRNNYLQIILKIFNKE